MNKQDRKELLAAIEVAQQAMNALDALAENERQKLENMPDSLRWGESGEAIEEVADELEIAVSKIKDGVEYAMQFCEQKRTETMTNPTPTEQFDAAFDAAASATSKIEALAAMLRVAGEQVVAIEKDLPVGVPDAGGFNPMREALRDMADLIEGMNYVRPSDTWKAFEAAGSLEFVMKDELSFMTAQIKDFVEAFAGDD